VGLGSAHLVAQLMEQRERALQVPARLVVTRTPGMGAGEAAVDTGLCGAVAPPFRGTQSGPLGGQPAVPVPVPIQELRDRQRQLPGVGVEPVVAACPIAASRTGRSVANHCSASSRPVSASGAAPGCAGAGVTGSSWGSSSIAALAAVCP
jgi:hypothetical protein